MAVLPVLGIWTISPDGPDWFPAKEHPNVGFVMAATERLNVRFGANRRRRPSVDSSHAAKAG